MSDVLEFDAFVRHSLPRVLAFAIWYCGNRQNAEDAVQDAFALAYAEWPRLTHPETWVRTVVMRRYAKEARKWWWRPRARVELEIAIPARNVTEDEFHASEVIRAIGLLPRRQRQIAVMVWLQGLSYEDTAGELGITAGAVGAHLARARARLRELLDIAGATAQPQGDPFVAAPQGSALRRAEATDPVFAALLAADEWLVQVLAQDTATRDRVEAAVRSAIGRRETR
jgi:RNA polymerase sigma-70 factor (ECF subfamily)